MKLDQIALILVIVAAVAYLLMISFGLIVALPIAWPLLILVAIGLFLVIRVIRDRLNNAEDDYYEKNVKD